MDRRYRKLCPISWITPILQISSLASTSAWLLLPLLYRLPADPGNKTDDTDLCAIHRATTNGFGLIEPQLDDVHGSLRLLARHRRSLVRRNASLRNQIDALLDVFLPGYTRLFYDIFDNQA